MWYCWEFLTSNSDLVGRLSAGIYMTASTSDLVMITHVKKLVYGFYFVPLSYVLLHCRLIRRQRVRGSPHMTPPQSANALVKSSLAPYLVESKT